MFKFICKKFLFKKNKWGSGEREVVGKVFVYVITSEDLKKGKLYNSEDRQAHYHNEPIEKNIYVVQIVEHYGSRSAVTLTVEGREFIRKLSGNACDIVKVKGKVRKEGPYRGLIYVEKIIEIVKKRDPKKREVCGDLPEYYHHRQRR